MITTRFRGHKLTAKPKSTDMRQFKVHLDSSNIVHRLGILSERNKRCALDMYGFELKKQKNKRLASSIFEQ